MVKNAMAFGELFVTHTDQFTWHWDDEGTGGRETISCWHPNAPIGYKPLGTLAIPAWHASNLPGSGKKLDEHVVAVCVKQHPDVPSAKGKPALADPVDYELVWDDKGSGSKYAGSFWRPTPPAGYVALGLVVSKNSYDKPPLDAVTCVREDLTHTAVPSADRIYADKGTGAKRAFSAWSNIVPPAYVGNTDDVNRFLLAPNTFTGHAAYDKPQYLPDMHVLCLPMRAERSEPAPFPALEGRRRPSGNSVATVANAVWLPFTAVHDPDKSTEWKLGNSPFYRIERKASWNLLSFINNTTDSVQTVTDSVTTGVEKETTDTFSVNTGISISGTSGVSVGVINTSVTTTFSLEMGFSRSTGVKELESRTVSRTLQAPADHAVALWVGTHTLQVMRADKTRVGAPLSFHGDSFHYDQYPDAPGSVSSQGHTATLKTVQPSTTGSTSKTAASAKRTSRQT
ncbi:Vps62-related protein [Streptomyces sp. NPDC051582]|uniref:Vps62-related protein n=1 Tax=Streptomyces sp. NPDC051582 TaxID=3155167 RepID=UPI003442E931